jgi:DNA-binding MarR family transcriptional regulator
MFICDISILNRYGKQRLDEMLKPLELDWHMLAALLVIDQLPGVSQTRLSPFLQTDKANITKLLQLMEKKGLIRREMDGSDQRNKVCYLTDEGQSKIPELQETLDKWEAACFKGVSEEDLLIYRKTSEIITGNLLREWKADIYTEG